MKTRTSLISILLSLHLILTACAPAKTEGNTAPSPVPAVTDPTATPVPTELPTSQPAASENPHGTVIYDDAVNIASINMDTGETKVLVSRDEIQILLGEDKSADSYTYGYERPVPIVLSPDLTKAYISICAALDSRFRCVFEDYIYTLESKKFVKLPMPPNSYGVYWKWSPDGSSLAGAAWTYDAATYLITRFYSVRSDGTELKTLDAISNDRWRIAWHPNSKAVLPLTFVTNFQMLHADGSKKEDVLIEGLEWNDRLECISFSPDHAQAAFIIRRDLPKDHDWLYIARSNFTEVSLLTEFDLDSRYTCNVDWSPDRKFIHLRYEFDSRVETGQIDPDRIRPPLDKVFNLQTGSPVNTPEDSSVCGWTPQSLLVFETPGTTEEEKGIDTLNLTDLSTAHVPVEARAALDHCPVQWLDKGLALDIPVGLSISNACHPGEIHQDDDTTTTPIPALFDIEEVSTTLNGEVLNVTMTMNTVSADLSEYLTPDVTEFFNGWDVFIDVDNNVLTGDRLGIDFRFSVAIRPGKGSTPPALGNVLLKYDPVSQSSQNTGRLEMALDPETRTLTLTGSIPGITEASRLIFLSRKADAASQTVIGDRLCD